MFMNAFVKIWFVEIYDDNLEIGPICGECHHAGN